MPGSPVDPAGGKLVENIMHFARTLRAVGLPVGPGKVLDAIRAVETVGLARRDDFYWALHAVFVNRRDQRQLFDQAFHIFWRNPNLLEQMLLMILPTIRVEAEPDPAEMSRRLAEALRAAEPPDAAPPGEAEIEIDAAMTWSDRELLQRMDFEKMSSDEVARAKRLIATMRLPIVDLPTRRFRAHPRGRRVDLRATMRAALRFGGDIIPLRWKRRRRRHPPLVVLCDISGSMSRYSRMLIHFMHAVTNDRDRVHTFLFGTRLSNVTRHLRHKDVDVALEKVAGAVDDWSGGTRIGRCLDDFNLNWSRRVLAQGAVVLLITDGLERDLGQRLERAVERLHKSCRRLIWLNPLLRYDGFEPRSMGAKAIMPHVDDFRPVHNLESLDGLVEVLGRPGIRREDPTMARWREKAA
jgi:uncharacterized protein with von Willebrand factor type A (vWA) domain